MPHPSAVRTDIGSVLCFVACATGGAFLTGIGQIDLFYLDAKPFRFVSEECRQLIEAPTVFHPVVFAGFGPTTFACRALAYSCKRLYFDRSYAMLIGMIDNLSGKLMVDILHPSGFFALAFPYSTEFLGLLEFLATAIEATAHMPLITAIAKEAGSLA